MWMVTDYMTQDGVKYNTLKKQLHGNFFQKLSIMVLDILCLATKCKLVVWAYASVIVLWPQAFVIMCI